MLNTNFTINIYIKKVLDLRSDEENPDAPDGIECLDAIPSEDNDAESILHSMKMLLVENPQFTNILFWIT